MTPLAEPQICVTCPAIVDYYHASARPREGLALT